MSEIRPTTAQASSRFWLYSFWIVLVLAFVNRWAMSVNGYASTFDTGTPGLMAVKILQGERPLFFYGQHYMGALEAYLAALLFSLFGISETVKTLSPILFSLGWIAATYALFTECMDRKAGFAAALVLAYPGWQTLWYNIGTYGGYPGAFFFGSTVLWLSVRVLKRKVTGRELLLYLPWIGLLAGLGLWTNYICGAYLGLAAILLIIHKVKVVGFRQDNLPYLLAGLPFLIALSPVLEAMLHSGGGGRVASFSFRINEFEDRFALMTSNLLPELFYWPFRFSDPVKKLLAAMLVPALAVTGVAFWKPREGISRKWMLIPVYFVALYLAIYLPHSMASIRASRYLIPGYSIFLCIVFSYGLCAQGSGWRFLASVMLIYWTAYNAFSANHMMELKVDKTMKTQAARQEVIQTCARLGITEVNLVGGFIFGHLGQTFSYLSKGQIAFCSTFDERHPQTSQALEAPESQALLCERSHESKIKETLRTLDVSYQVKRLKQYSLFYDVSVNPISTRLLPDSEFQVTRMSDQQDLTDILSDRRLSSFAEEVYGKKTGLQIDFKQARQLNQFWLISPGYKQTALPKKLVIQSSLDGITWDEPIQIHTRVAPAYTSGRGVYILGYSNFIEYRFSPIQAQYLRIHFRQGSHPSSPAKIGELFVFEAAPDPEGSLEEDLDSMEGLLRDGTLNFLTADRWVSGSLFKRPGLQDKVMSRFNPKFRSTWFSRYITPLHKSGLAVDRSVADETEQILLQITGPTAVPERIDLNYYTLFRFEEAPIRSPYEGERYHFNGHALISRDYDAVKDLEFIHR